MPGVIQCCMFGYGDSKSESEGKHWYLIVCVPIPLAFAGPITKTFFSLHPISPFHTYKQTTHLFLSFKLFAQKTRWEFPSISASLSEPTRYVFSLFFVFISHLPNRFFLSEPAIALNWLLVIGYSYSCIVDFECVNVIAQLVYQRFYFVCVGAVLFLQLFDIFPRPKFNMSSFVGVLVSDQWLQSQFTQVELRTLKSKVSICFFVCLFVPLFSSSSESWSETWIVLCSFSSMYRRGLNRDVLLWEICHPFLRNWRLSLNSSPRMRLRLSWQSRIRTWMKKLTLSPSLGWVKELYVSVPIRSCVSYIVWFFHFVRIVCLLLS